MGQLTLGQLEDFIKDCKKQGLDKNTPVYVGDDDELNGIHCAWYIQTVERGIDEDSDYLISMIDDRSGNHEAQKINILIS